MFRFTPLLALSLASCATETISDVETYLGCPGGACNSNSPVMGPYEFWEGNLAGAVNNAGVRFGYFVSGGASFTPSIVGDRLQARPLVGTGILSGTQLENGYLQAFTPTGMFKIVIKKVNTSTQFWQGPATTVETYEMAYIDPANSFHETLCDNPPASQEPDDNGHAWAAPLEAVLYTGDRYDEKTRKVIDISVTGTRNWFNIGCAGSALMKMHLNRHTTASAVSGYTTSQPARQAMFKMFASDICGDGEVFTYKGVPLRWQNAPGWSKLTGTEYAWESRWDEKGAQCLDMHRLGTTYAQAIADHCKLIGKELTPCNGDVHNPTLSPGTLFISALPSAPP